MESDEVTTASTLPPMSKPVTNGLNVSSPCEMKTKEEAPTPKDAITTVNNSEHKNENDDTQSNVTSQTTSQQIKSEQESDNQLLNNATPCDTQAALIPDQTSKQTTATTLCKTKAQSSPISHTKGQLISKCSFGIKTSSKKPTKKFSRISAVASKMRSNQKK